MEWQSILQFIVARLLGAAGLFLNSRPGNYFPAANSVLIVYLSSYTLGARNKGSRTTDSANFLHLARIIPPPSPSPLPFDGLSEATGWRQSFCNRVSNVLLTLVPTAIGIMAEIAQPEVGAATCAPSTGNSARNAELVLMVHFATNTVITDYSFSPHAMLAP